MTRDELLAQWAASDPSVVLGLMDVYAVQPKSFKRSRAEKDFVVSSMMHGYAFHTACDTVGFKERRALVEQAYDRLKGGQA